MEIRELSTFAMVAEVHSFSEAAKRLGYTQSAVSMQMRKLETETGSQLLRYDQRQVQLTSAGQAMMPLVQRMLADYGTLQQFTHSTQNFDQLRVAAPESLTITMVAAALQQFQQQYPGTEIQLQNATCLHNEDALIRGDVDIAFMMWPSRPNVQLIDYDLGEQEMVLVTSDSTITFTDLLRDRSATFVINEPDCSYRNQFETALWQQYQRRFQTMSLPSIAAIKAAVMSGLGFSYLPRSMVTNEIATGQFTVIPTDIENHIHAHLLTRRKLAKDSAANQFITAFQTIRERW